MFRRHPDRNDRALQPSVRAAMSPHESEMERRQCEDPGSLCFPAAAHASLCDFQAAVIPTYIRGAVSSRG